MFEACLSWIALVCVCIMSFESLPFHAMWLVLHGVGSRNCAWRVRLGEYERVDVFHTINHFKFQPNLYVWKLDLWWINCSCQIVVLSSYHANACVDLPKNLGWERTMHYKDELNVKSLRPFPRKLKKEQWEASLLLHFLH